MNIKQYIEENNPDMVEVICKDYRQCNLAPMWFIHEKYDGTDVMLEIPKKATLSMVDGKKVLTFTL